MLIFITPSNIPLQNVFNGGYQYQYHFAKAEQTKFKLLTQVPVIFRKWQSGMKKPYCQSGEGKKKGRNAEGDEPGSNIEAKKREHRTSNHKKEMKREEEEEEEKEARRRGGIV